MANRIARRKHPDIMPGDVLGDMVVIIGTEGVPRSHDMRVVARHKCGTVMSVLAKQFWRTDSRAYQGARSRCCPSYHLNANGYRMIGMGSQQMQEHRYLMGWIVYMEEGRDLHPHENVHHINGDKLDNSIANLELWSTKQPKGQRIPDKVAYATEILSLYAPELLAA